MYKRLQINRSVSRSIDRSIDQNLSICKCIGTWSSREYFWKARFLTTGGSWWWSPISATRLSRERPVAASGFCSTIGMKASTWERTSEQHHVDTHLSVYLYIHQYMNIHINLYTHTHARARAARRSIGVLQDHRNEGVNLGLTRSDRSISISESTYVPPSRKEHMWIKRWI